MVKPFDEQPGIEKWCPGIQAAILKTLRMKRCAVKRRDIVKPFKSRLILMYSLMKNCLNYFGSKSIRQMPGQFADRGSSYRAAIFYHNDKQKELAEASKQRLAESGIFKDPIVTDILKAEPFYEAEGYHQHFYKKNPAHYQRYRTGSGRAGFISEHWGAK